jgi:hypothetical protein
MSGLLAVPASTLAGQSTDSGSSAAIGGTIFDRNTNRPVIGVRLRLMAPGLVGWVRHTTTDSLGKYVFEDIDRGDYTLTLARLGYHPLELDVLINRSAPVAVSVGLIPAAVALPDVTVEAGQPPHGTGTRGTPSVISRRNTIEAVEIDERGMLGQDAYAVLRRLRPDWLNRRAGSRIVGSENQIILYVDNVRRGALDELRSIDAGMIARVHYFDPLLATQEWGTGHVNGAINVVLKPPGR